MGEFPHFIIYGTSKTEKYTAAGGGGGGEYTSPPREESRVGRGNRLAGETKKAADSAAKDPEKAAEGITFIPLVVRSDPGIKLFLDSLEDKRIGSEIIAFRYESDGSERATIHVPVENIAKFAKKFEDHASKNVKGTDTPVNLRFVDSVTEIRLAMLRDGAYWTENEDVPSMDEEFWWEVWLRDDGEEIWGPAGAFPVVRTFRIESAQLGIQVSDREVRFPDLVVVLARSSMRRWSEFPGLLRYLAEFRRANIIAQEYMAVPPAGQSEFVQAMVKRTRFAGENSPAVTILDYGVNRGHPLLAGALAEQHNIAYDDDWGAADRGGHGTEMAGLALYGPDLGSMLISSESIDLKHGLESIKICSDARENDPPDYGPITVGAVAKIEVIAPHRARVLCMAVTATDKDKWAPTLWSSAIDQMCSGATDGTRRLMIVSAGNHPPDIRHQNYPESNYNLSIEDPSQAWNVLTVGAYTEKVTLTDPDLAGWNPLAPKGRLSPSSRTSCSWDKDEFPLKPDVVMEGGNCAYNSRGFASYVDDLSLLTTTVSEDGALLGMMRETSAATALAARFAAILQAEYPALWPRVTAL